jgi:hypothetical protein
VTRTLSNLLNNKYNLTLNNQEIRVANAAGDASTTRPDAEVVLWINTPNQPVNLGPNDLWKDDS